MQPDVLSVNDSATVYCVSINSILLSPESIVFQRLQLSYCFIVVILNICSIHFEKNSPSRLCKSYFEMYILKEANLWVLKIKQKPRDYFRGLTVYQLRRNVSMIDSIIKICQTNSVNGLTHVQILLIFFNLNKN